MGTTYLCSFSWHGQVQSDTFLRFFFSLGAALKESGTLDSNNQAWIPVKNKSDQKKEAKTATTSKKLKQKQNAFKTPSQKTPQESKSAKSKSPNKPKTSPKTPAAVSQPASKPKAEPKAPAAHLEHEANWIQLTMDSTGRKSANTIH